MLIVDFITCIKQIGRLGSTKKTAYHLEDTKIHHSTTKWNLILVINSLLLYQLYKLFRVRHTLLEFYMFYDMKSFNPSLQVYMQYTKNMV